MRGFGLVALAGLVLLTITRGAAAAEDPPSFSKDVKPFLTHYCVDCHGADKTKAGVKLDSYKSMMEGSKKKVIVPGKPDQSRLILVLTGHGKQMPPKKYSAHPTTKEIAVVQAWIAAGAKDDTVKVGALLPGGIRTAATPAGLRARSVPVIREDMQPLWLREFSEYATDAALLDQDAWVP